MKQPICTVPEWHNVTHSQFHSEIIPLNKPALFRGLVGDWPIVQASHSGAPAVANYLKSLDSGQAVYTIVGAPDINGGFSYDKKFNGVNFERRQANLSNSVDQLLALTQVANPHAVAVQAAPVKTTLSGFVERHALPLLDASVEPTMWLGNRAMVAPHYDVNFNLAAVVSGRRKFTLFPPEQVANLYVGPMLDSPGGVPTSLVDLRNPDMSRFPLFEKALKAAVHATLEPGDVIYIPTPWWHAVESLDPFNVLINYWWGGIAEHGVSPNNSLMHSMLSIAQLDTDQRHAWRHLFDYFVFHTTGDPAEHLPNDVMDVITRLSPEQRQQVFAFLKSRLN
ncbi:cupin-like domain-containing protein [Arenicella xantha]|uniref:Cupin-like protein n=1 Tax=Arenicella xantha TaxID=644221 RepID=A0A395JJ82_9GAMM|nr:cupin-like domain-containing protein [Arenicella xantha]RBP48734.1 cupin-like protein [Arenicella xantha]